MWLQLHIFHCCWVHFLCFDFLHSFCPHTDCLQQYLRYVCILFILCVYLVYTFWLCAYCAHWSTHTIGLLNICDNKCSRMKQKAKQKYILFASKHTKGGVSCILICATKCMCAIEHINFVVVIVATNGW